MSSWPDQDNKAVRGPSDSDYVSLTESWERTNFANYYLQLRNYNLSDKSRQVIYNVLDSCPLKAPIRLVDLVAYLDQQVHSAS